MVIRKDGPRQARVSVKKGQRCWDCGVVASVFVVSPSSGHSLCEDCGGRYFVGVEPVRKRAKAPDA